MSQTVNGENASDKTPRPVPPRVYRPGQRQQGRMQRLARRQKRRRIAAGTIAAILLIAAGIAATLSYQHYNDLRIAANSTAAAIVNAHATSTADAHANATATVVTKDCFLSPNAAAVPSIYASSATPSAGPTSAPAISGKSVNGPDGLQYVDIKVGTGVTVQSGNTISVNYTGWIASTCQKFDSSYDGHASQSGQTQPAQPFSTAIGQGQVIKGWDEGIVGMKVGGIRRLSIPAALGYGAQGSPPAIPANANLIFDVQILSAK